MDFQSISTRVAIFGHPIHPLMIHFPVAALLALTAADLGYWWTGDVFWVRAGFWLSAVGTIGGWAAGSIGLIDLVTVARIRRLITAWCHGILAVMLLSLASLNLMLRWGDPAEMAANIMPRGLYLSVLTSALIGVTGYLGGRLVYEYAVGVEVPEGAEPEVTP